MAFGIDDIALIVMGLASATSAAVAATATGPEYPDAGASSKKASDAEAQALPARRMLEAAARLGIPVDVPTSQQKPIYKESAFVKVKQGGIGSTPSKEKLVPYVESDWQPGGKYYQPGQPAPEIIKQRTISGYEPVTKRVDFTGQGEIDTQKKLAQQMAQINLDLSEKYGTKFAQSSAELLKRADPEGAAARDKMLEIIQEQQNAQPERPVADTLDAQILDELTRGTKLDSSAASIVQGLKANRAGLGDTIRADLEGDLAQGSAGEARRLARTQKATSWLSSGATPEDVDYRRNQQNLSNQMSFLAGKTPVSQFGQLSGASRGATPVMTGASLPVLGTGTGDAAQSTAARNYATQQQNVGNTVNNWFAGVSTALKGLNVAGAAGWKPLA